MSTRIRTRVAVRGVAVAAVARVAVRVAVEEEATAMRVVLECTCSNTLNLRRIYCGR